MKRSFVQKNYLRISFILFFSFQYRSFASTDKHPKIRINKSSILQNQVSEIREWAFDIYIAADNDLHFFAWDNIKQLAQGANKNLHIVVQLNEPGRNKKTQRYLIEKNKATLLNKDNQQKLDSGDPQTLIDFAIWSIKNFPAKKRMLILSNHGSGIIDRSVSRLINPTEFFVLNPSNLMLDLDRNLEFLKYLSKPRDEEQEFYGRRGLCYDETFQTYFTNQKLEYALKTICQEANKHLNIQDFKYAIFGMDACLMQMIEISNILKYFATISVASAEVELGPGWKYDKILKVFEQSPPDELALAKYIVQCYEDVYSKITNDYTLSAIDLSRFSVLEQNINSTAELLIDFLQSQKNNSVRSLIKKSKSNISFEEPSYIDLGSFYLNILNELDNASINEEKLEIKTKLKENITQGLKIIQAIVIENVSGKNIKYSKGLSIYFPEKRIHNSYRQTNFFQSNQWSNFISHYISM